MEIKLTQYSKGAGCGCKIAPQQLKTILNDLAPAHHKQLIVGNEDADDAAVYALNETQALIATTDFFLPIVDDPYLFGYTAALNAISDVYAMGGDPLLALAILSWPLEKIPVAYAQKVMQGGQDACMAHGIALAGGHSIDGQDPIFGLSVTGLVEISNIKQNKNAQAGDVLILTKPIGIGVLSTALKRGVINEEDQNLLHDYLKMSNRIGSEIGKISGVHAMTDITGFGLAGHLLEILQASNLYAEVNYAQIPKISAALNYLQQKIVPDATYRNWNSYHTEIGFGAGVNVMEAFSLLPDPQTNGGLLICAKEELARKIIELLHESGNKEATIIGSLQSSGDKRITVV